MIQNEVEHNCNQCQKRLPGQSNPIKLPYTLATEYI